MVNELGHLKESDIESQAQEDDQSQIEYNFTLGV